MKITETIMQAVLMNWAMNGHNHIYVVPNSTVIFPWESDLISVTRAMYIHEYEIKISLADYKKDADKVWKHMSLQLGDIRNTPNYFWYVTYDFDIEPPKHAGWIKVTQGKYRHDITVKREAPLLCKSKLNAHKLEQIANLLSFRLTNTYMSYLHQPVQAELFEEA